MIRKKIRSRRGLTLAETLTALAVFAILSVALLQGINAAWKVYRKAVLASEARTLQSTLVQALSNELRYARNIRVETEGGGTGGEAGGGTGGETGEGTGGEAGSQKVIFDSDLFGQGVSVINGTDDAGNADGQIRIGVEGQDGKIYDVVGSKTYTNGLKAHVTVSYDEEKGLFGIELTVTQDSLLPQGLTTELTVRALNAPGAQAGLR